MVLAKKWGLDKKPQKWDIQDQTFAFQGKSILLEDTDGEGKFKRMLSFLLVDKDILRKQPTHAHSLFV